MTRLWIRRNLWWILTLAFIFLFFGSLLYMARDHRIEDVCDDYYTPGEFTARRGNTGTVNTLEACPWVIANERAQGSVE